MSCLRQNIISLLVPMKIIMSDLNLAASSQHLHYPLAIHTPFHSPNNCLHTFTKPWQDFDPNLDGFCWTIFPACECVEGWSRIWASPSISCHNSWCDCWKSSSFLHLKMLEMSPNKKQGQDGEIICTSNLSASRDYRPGIGLTLLFLFVLHLILCHVPGQV